MTAAALGALYSAWPNPDIAKPIDDLDHGARWKVMSDGLKRQ